MTLDLDATLSLCYMLVPCLRVESSFYKCTNASLFSLLSLLTGFDKLICVCACMHSLSCLIHCLQNGWDISSLTQFLSQKWKCMPIYHTVHCNFPTLLPPWCGRRASWATPEPGHLVLQGACTVAFCVRASKHGLLISLLTLVCGISVLNWSDGMVVMVTPRT